MIKTNRCIIFIMISILIVNICACSKKEINIGDNQIRPVKELSDVKKDEFVLKIDNFDLNESLRSFDEAHFKQDSIQLNDGDSEIFIELSNKDYQNAFEDYVNYTIGRYPDKAKCVIKNDEYTIWEGKGYQVAIQLNEKNDLYLFKWTDNKTKESCLEAFNKFNEKLNERWESIGEILDMLDEQYPYVDKELREVFYTNRGFIYDSVNKNKIELSKENIDKIKEYIEESTLDIGDSVYDLGLEDSYYEVQLISDDGLVGFKMVSSIDKIEFYTKDGRIINKEEDEGENNILNKYIKQLIK